MYTTNILEQIMVEFFSCRMSVYDVSFLALIITHSGFRSPAERAQTGLLILSEIQQAGKKYLEENI